MILLIAVLISTMTLALILVAILVFDNHHCPSIDNRDSISFVLTVQISCRCLSARDHQPVEARAYPCFSMQGN